MSRFAQKAKMILPFFVVLVPGVFARLNGASVSGAKNETLSHFVQRVDLGSVKTPCASKVMFTVDRSASNLYLKTVVGFLKKYIFYEGGFNPTKDVLGISSYFQHPQSYTMVSQWGGYQNVADVRRDLDNWKTEPNTYSGLKNALHDLLYSWPDSSTTTRFVLFTPTVNPEDVKSASEHLQGIKKRGKLTVIVLGKVDPAGVSLLKQSNVEIINWFNPNVTPVLPNYQNLFWKIVYGCAGKTRLRHNAKH